MPVEIEATYRVVTPLFCAGADQRRAELRAPSLKGVLRFWWRALAWSRCNGDLERIYTEEAALFGSSDVGRSRVSIRVDLSDVQKSVSGKDLQGTGVRYLGYGMTERDPRRERRYLPPPLAFTVHVRAHGLHPGQLVALRRALIALGLFGGVGARSRKGFGSLVLDSLRSEDDVWLMPRTVDDLRGRIIETHTRDGPNRLPEYSALSPRTRHVLLSSPEANLLRLLDIVGLELQEAIRSCNRQSRVVFGLPRGQRKERRASPLFFHMHECGRKPVVVVSFLPACFLPNGAGILGRGKRVLEVPATELYRPVEDFLDRLLDPTKRKQPLRAAEVKP